MRKFLLFSLFLHLVVVIVLFVGLPHRPDISWGGGRPAVVTVYLASDFPLPGGERGRERVIPRPPSPQPPPIEGGGEKGAGAGINGGTGEGFDSSSNTHPSILALITKKIEQAKRYPPEAKSQGVEGTVVLQFTIAANGRLEASQVSRSSGSPLLDDEALATLSRGAPYPFYDGEISVGLKFDLED